MTKLPQEEDTKWAAGVVWHQPSSQDMIAHLEAEGYTITAPYKEPEFKPGDWIAEVGSGATLYIYAPISDCDPKPFIECENRMFSMLSRDQLPEKLEIWYRGDGAK